jgi:23S rRNA (adenine2030-N6)-methyltransferase
MPEARATISPATRRPARARRATASGASSPRRIRRRRLKPYLDIVRALNAPGGSVLRYPGSPWIARKLTRPQDRLLLCELHPEDVIELKRATAGDRRIEVRRADGWIALKSDLPPAERRGLVLIDPPFEAKDEYARLARGLRHAYRRFATGVLVAWYPIKTREPVDAFHAEVVAAGLKRVTVAELLVRAPAAPKTRRPASPAAACSSSIRPGP